MTEFSGLVTGIGSLPHKEASQALDLVFKYLPDIPFWPQLPKRDIREGMVAQFSENLPGITVNDAGIFFQPQEKELEVFYEKVITLDTDYFKIGPRFSSGLGEFYRRLDASKTRRKFLKCQITGPFTFAAGINSEKGISLLHDPVYMQVVLKGLSMKALWQIRTFSAFSEKIIIFLDEPYLSCFGSAYTPINREQVIAGLNEITGAIKSENVLVGVHCCGNTDWSMFTETKNIDIINFDAFGFLDKFTLYAANIGEFLSRGGVICWGIVPTQELTPAVTADSLAKRVRAGIDAFVRKGLSEDLLLGRMLLSPACGLGSLDVEISEKILKTLGETSREIRKSA